MTRLVPDRWLQYTPHGEVIKGTRIVALKVPLKEGRSRSLQASERFTPKMMMEALPAVKYIVDLTFTHGYYDRKEFLDAGVGHVKILVPGKVLPPPNAVKQFFKALDDFLATAKSDELVGVHCTHGVNRTGYFICRYLIQQLGWDIQEAIKAFETARGHPMERENYVDHLRRTPRGQRIDTSNVSLESEHASSAGAARGGTQPTGGARRSTKRPASHWIAGPPSGFHSLRRGFANGRPFPPHPPPPDHLGFRPRFGRPPPILPPPPPPPTRTPFGPRSMRYGRPPAPGFPNPAFPPRMPPPPPLMVPVGGPRLPPPPPSAGPGPRPPPGLGPRLPPGPGPMRPPPGPGLPRVPSMMPMPGPGPRPPRLGLPPSPVTPTTTMAKGTAASSPNQRHRHPSRPHLSKEGSTARNVRASRQTPPNPSAVPLFNENFQQDFTVDTFEENLTTTELSAPSRPGAPVASAKRRYRGRGGHRSSRGK